MSRPLSNSQLAAPAARNRKDRGGRLGLGLVLLLLLPACSRNESKNQIQSSQALGIVLAEETARLAGGRKQIALISPDLGKGSASTVEVAFKAALKKHGLSIMAAKAANLGDPMHYDQFGLRSADFLEVIGKYPDAGAIVSLVGAPLLKPGEAARVPPEHPPVLVVATAELGGAPGVPGNALKLATLLEAKLIQLAIIDGAASAAAKPGKLDATHEVFAQNYRLLRRSD